MTAAIVAALATGLLGSLHCATMCGPLAIAGSVGGRALGYLGGRLVSYAAVGALFGLIGQHALCVLPVAQMQLVAVGLVGLFALYKAWTLLRPRAVRAARPIALARRRTPLLGRLLALAPRRGFGLGLATGVLPCGMLIPAWTLAMASGGAASGAMVMAAFYAGSAPGLILPLLAGRFARGFAARIPPALQAAAWGLLAVAVAVRPLLATAHHH